MGRFDKSRATPNQHFLGDRPSNIINATIP
jgi:hypothetical protein